MADFAIKKRDDKPSGEDVIVYTFSNNYDYEDDDGFPLLDTDESQDIFKLPDAYAIKITRGAKTTYYVKRGKYGKLFNPIGMYSEGTEHRQMRHAGKPEWEFKSTNSKVFNYYINFLKTKNAAWLNNAEREV